MGNNVIDAVVDISKFIEDGQSIPAVWQMNIMIFCGSSDHQYVTSPGMSIKFFYHSQLSLVYITPTQ